MGKKNIAGCLDHSASVGPLVPGLQKRNERGVHDLRNGVRALTCFGLKKIIKTYYFVFVFSNDKWALYKNQGWYRDG